MIKQLLSNRRLCLKFILDLRFCNKSLNRLIMTTTTEASDNTKYNIGEAVKKDVAEMKGGEFISKVDRFNLVIVESTNHEVDRVNMSHFPNILKLSLENWKSAGHRGVWFHVAPEHSEWIPVLVSHGFKFHHANSSRLALYLWLSEGEAPNIPSYAHTLIGVGAMVINDKDEILVVQERFYTAPHWKLPGGYVDPGENIPEASIREVKEETGVNTTFRSIVAFRHGHKFSFGCSDIYIIVALAPLTDQINACRNELSACKWMPIEEYRNHDLVHNVNRFFINQYLKCRKNNSFIGLTEIELQIKDFIRAQNIYSIGFSDDQENDCDENAKK